MGCCPMPELEMSMGIELRVGIKWVKVQEETSPLFFSFFFASRAVLKQSLVSFIFVFK